MRGYRERQRDYLSICLSMSVADNLGNEDWWDQAACEEWNRKEKKGRGKERKILEEDLQKSTEWVT